MRNEARFRMVERAFPERFKVLLDAAQKHVHEQRAQYEDLAGRQAGK
jgi:hypothetical protein